MADPAVYDESTGNWTFFFTGSGLTSVMNWGFPGATPALGDYDGDGKGDACVYCPPAGTWYARGVPGLSLIFFGFVWGETNTVAVPADYDGDGVADLAGTTPTSGLWHIRSSANLFTNDLFWGWPNAIPVPADYDGDGRSDHALYTTTDGTWHVAFAAGTTQSFPSIDSRISRAVPVPADYDGDHHRPGGIHQVGVPPERVEPRVIADDAQMRYLPCMKRRSVLLHAVMLAASFSPLFPAGPSTSLCCRSMDCPDLYLSATNRNLCRNLAALRARGSSARSMIAVYPSVTYASHASLATGTTPARHGVTANNVFDPVINGRGFWFASMCKCRPSGMPPRRPD